MTEDTTIFKNTKLDIWTYSTDTLAILIYDYMIAKKLNKTLQYYDSKIVEGDEPVFLITRPLIPLVSSLIVPTKGKTAMEHLLSKYIQK
jgi:hypothetical protein